MKKQAIHVLITTMLLAASASASVSVSANVQDNAIRVSGTGSDVSLLGLELAVYKMEVDRFIAVEGLAPADEKDLIQNGYLFFLPALTAVKWEQSDGLLTLSTVDASVQIPLPGSEVYKQRQKALKETTLSAAHSFRRMADVTPEDVEKGLVSLDEWQTLKAYSESNEEWRQLCWARSLATTIAHAVQAYRLQNPHNPEYPTLEELLEFAGKVNPAAWNSPLTGYYMKLQPYQSTMDPYYLGGGDSWELTVPLFGAGGNKPNAHSFFFTGKHFKPGEYIRVGYGPGTYRIGGVLMSY